MGNRTQLTPDLKPGYHPSGPLLSLAALGLALTIWSLWDLSGHATRMAAVQDAATVADSVAAFLELSNDSDLEDRESTPGARSTGAKKHGKFSPETRVWAFIQRLENSRVGATVTLHEAQGQRSSSQAAPDTKTPFLSLARTHLQNSPSSSYYDFETDTPTPVVRYVITDSTAPKGNFGVPSSSALIEVSIPLDPKLIIDSEVDLNQGLRLFSFLMFLWFSVAGVALIGSRRSSRAALNHASKQNESNLKLESLILEREAAEHETRQLEKQISSAERTESLNLVAGGLAHDFNNLLVPILANADFLKEEVPTDSPAREMLEDIDIAAGRAADLCAQMLAYAGKSSTEYARKDLNEIVKDVTEHLNIDNSKNLIIETSVGSGPFFTVCDERQIGQALLSLISNAAEAIGDVSGKIIVRTGSFRTAPGLVQEGELLHEDDSPIILPPLKKQEQRVFFEVSDNGCGISQENLKKIFDPFYSTKFAGRGLGLAALQGIVDSHSGLVRVESQVGIYTRVRVEFARVEAGVAAPGDTVSPLRPEEHRRDRGKILLADDEPAVRAVAQRILEESGFEVIPASTGLEATEKFASHFGDFDACVFDLTMPTKDGDRALQEIREINPVIPAVLMSGYSERIDEIEETRGPYTAFVHKPFRAAALRKALIGVLNHSTDEPAPLKNPATARSAGATRGGASGSNASVAQAP
ncbi:MAG: response regulator [Myxococcota bacterium]|nr:response regulator [Myxococcota bacterium]